MTLAKYAYQSHLEDVGEEHVATMSSRASLATLYHQNDQYKKAEELYLLDLHLKEQQNVTA